jgi:hypothetical protein
MGPIAVFVDKVVAMVVTSSTLTVETLCGLEWRDNSFLA